MSCKQLSWGKLSRGQLSKKKLSKGQLSRGKLSRAAVVQGRNCPGGQLCKGEIVLEGNYPGDDYQGAVAQEGSYQGAIFQGDYLFNGGNRPTGGNYAGCNCCRTSLKRESNSHWHAFPTMSG